VASSTSGGKKTDTVNYSLDASEMKQEEKKESKEGGGLRDRLMAGAPPPPPSPPPPPLPTMRPVSLSSTNSPEKAGTKSNRPQSSSVTTRERRASRGRSSRSSKSSRRSKSLDAGPLPDPTHGVYRMSHLSRSLLSLSLLSLSLTHSL
jgi:hypothetical protein